MLDWAGLIGSRPPRDRVQVTLTLPSGRRVVGEAVHQDDEKITILVCGRWPATFRRDRIERMEIRRTVLEEGRRANGALTDAAALDGQDDTGRHLEPPI